MTIAQIATLVGQRLGIPTSDGTSRDGAAVRAFIIARHDQLYRAFAWKDSIIEFVLNIQPSAPYIPTNNYMPTKGQVILPSIFQHVMGVRFGHRPLKVEKPQLYYRVHYCNRDWTREFYLLSSCVWEFDTPQNLTLTNNNGADNNQLATLDELQPDGVSIVRSGFALNNAVMAGTTDRIDNLILPVLQGTVTLQAGATNIFTISASAPKCQRLKLIASPSTSWPGNCNLHVIGKRNTPVFASDSDSPGVNGLDGVLFAMAYYDMAIRDERGGSGDVLTALNEAVGPTFLTTGKPGGFLAKLIEEEVLQEAYNARIVPEHGFGGHYDEWRTGSKSDPYDL